MALSKTQYTIRIRDKNLLPQGALTTWTDALISLRMNDVGKWSLTVRADDSLRSFFTRGNGVIITRDLGDGSAPQVICSGPIWDVVRKGTDNTFLLGGPTDDLWLKVRNALPAGGRPYMEQVLMDSPVRYLRLDETSGTVATDSSLSKQNGTYVNAPTLNVAGAIPGDPDTAVTLAAASSQRVTVPGTSAPSGNSPVSLEILFKFAANPAAVQVIACYGDSSVLNHAITLFVDTAGKINVNTGAGSATITSAAAATTGVYHRALITWDGTTLSLILDNAAAVTGTPGTLAIPATPPINIGANNTPASFFSGQVDEFAVYAAALNTTQSAAHYAAFTNTHGTYDTRTGVASTVLIGYVNANLITPVNADRDMTVMSAAADPSVGTSVTGNARYDNLLALLQQLASAGGDIGFRVVQTANGVLQFQVYAPSDKTGNAKFSEALLNLFDYSYELMGPNSNSVEVLGGGTNAGRTAVRVQDATSIANWGLVEGPIVDARDTSDTAIMTQRGQAEVNAQSEAINLSITPRDTDSVTYGRDYNLGDIVAITIDGATITNKVRSVEIKLTTADQEIVTPGIGNPTQGQAAQFLADIRRAQQLDRVQAAINRLNGAV